MSPKIYSVKKILNRIFFSFLTFVILLFCTQKFIFNKLSLEITKQKTDLVFSAIEVGPLRFSRLHSSILANEFLSRILIEANKDHSIYISVKIDSGKDFSETFASWHSENQSVAMCLSEVQKIYSFPDAVYPYRLSLLFDRCAAVNSLRFIDNFFLFSVIFLIAILFVLLFFAIRPVVTSTRLLTYLISSLDDSSDANQICFEPMMKISEIFRKNKILERTSAVAGTVQMLAHDVRRPFSLLQISLDLFSRTRDCNELRNLTKKTIPEIQSSITQVNGLISDIMEVGSSRSFHTESVKISSIIDSALSEALQIYQNADIQFSYDFNHFNDVLVNSFKILRVFSNLIGNAFQAMNYKGEMWFRTEQIRSHNSVDNFVNVIIGNGGSFIKPDDVPLLFDAFFTKGKKEGTGLGLAIVKKIIIAHGGHISCKSEKNVKFPDGFVEFKFALPASLESSHDSSRLLFQSSKEMMDRQFHTHNDVDLAKSENFSSEECIIEAKLIDCLSSSPICMAIVDDESIYRNALINILIPHDGWKNFLNVVECSNSDEALLNYSVCDLLILDADLGCGSLSGFELASMLRKRGFSGFICIHSNRYLFEDQKKALDFGADVFIPKPALRIHLLSILLQAVQKKSGLIEISNKHVSESLTVPLSSSANQDSIPCLKFKIALISSQKIFGR